MNLEEIVYGTAGNETSLTIVFRKVTVEEVGKLETRPAVYKVYTKNEGLAYIGETNSLIRRIRGHLCTTEGKKEINRHTITHIEYVYVQADRYERAVIEGILVSRHKPKLNVTDEMNLHGRKKIKDEVFNDILFYLRNTDIRDYVLSRFFDADREAITNIRHAGTGNTLQLPSGFKPSKIITQEFIDSCIITNTPVTKSQFIKARNMLDQGGIKQNVIAKEIGISNSTMTNIKKLGRDDFKLWEKERLNATA